jgi:hypothetical protein
MISESWMRWLERNTVATRADAVRALRPGGPLDYTYYSTRCERCGSVVKQTLRWFSDCDYTCSCGGLYNTADFWACLNALAIGDDAKVRAITSISVAKDGEL